MEKVFQYSVLFDQAFQRIKAVRNPNAEFQEKNDLGWELVSRQQLFDFAGKDFEKINAVVRYAKEVSILCLKEILHQLFIHYKRNVSFAKVDIKEDERSKIIFSFFDNENKNLLLFKEIEKCSFWKLKDKEPDDIINAMETYGAEKCMYIYIVHDYAYMQVIGHNEDENDPGRGYNLFSMKWLFDTYFEKNEYHRFVSFLNVFTENVNSYIGYMYIKSLTPNAIITFKKIVGKEIRTKSYRKLLDTKIHELTLTEEAFLSISKQFIEDEKYKLLIGKSDFADSFVTAEWLYDSMKKAKAIDLTVVGMGYFKAVEQLLYEIICLHKNEKRKIRKDSAYQELPKFIDLDAFNIESKRIDSTMGSMANFYKNNLDMLRDDLKYQTKKFVKEFIFEYKNLRNGYFHKHNICEWATIEKIRDATFSLMFLMLGTYKFQEGDMAALGNDSMVQEDDFYKLCEYMNYHSGDLFFIKNDKHQDEIFWAHGDPYMETKDGHFAYSGVYIKELRPNGKVFKMVRERVADEIHLGTLGIQPNEEVKINPQKVKPIFIHGKFVGPLIEDECIMEY